MKKLLILLLSVLSLTAFAQQKQVAILEPIAITKEVSTMHRSMVRGEMVKAIGRQIGYAAFTRTDIDQIMTEQNFQQSGMVDDATRKRLGAMQGVDYVCVTKITKEGNNFYLEASLVNIETGKISNPATQYGELEGGSLSNMRAACEKLAAELVGGQEGATTTSIYKVSNITYSHSPSQTTTIQTPQNTVHKSGYIDLGLPSRTLWKTTNEGGDYARYTYNEAVSKFGNKLPTKQQFEELESTCTWIWEDNGYRVIGPNGNFIIFYAAGYRNCDGGVSGVGAGGYYWASTPNKSGGIWVLNFGGRGVGMLESYHRCEGRSVRLVQ